MKTILLFFFILLMATFRTVINREVRTVQSRNYNKSCIDRSIPNKIDYNPVKRGSLVLDKSGKLIIKL